MSDQPTLESRLASLEAKLQELEDDRKIRELLSRYGFNADLGRSAEWVGLWTDDGAFEVAIPRAWDAGIGDQETIDRQDAASTGKDQVVRHEGREALDRFIRDPESHKAIE